MSRGDCIYHGPFNTSSGERPECASDWDNDGDASRQGQTEDDE